jgi:3-methyl-2-oxobutanoate hydroxymethyltransferase
MGGFKVQGKTDKQAARITADAMALEEAGAFSIVLEGVPSKLAAAITHGLRIPTIGIGAGPATDGQVLVLHDMLGLTSGKAPKFVKRYANLAEEISRAATAYADDVRAGSFPGPEHEYSANGSAPPKDPEEVRYGASQTGGAGTP